MKLPKLQRKLGKKTEVPNYGIATEDEDIPDYGLDDLFDEGIQPEQSKQLVPKLSTYEESLAEFLEGKKQMYVDPQYLPLEYGEDEGPDYALDEEDKTNEILKDLEITDHDNVEKILYEPGITTTKIRSFLNNKVLKLAKFRRKQLGGYKTQVTKAYNRGDIGEAERVMGNRRIDDSRAVLNQYIK